MSDSTVCDIKTRDNVLLVTVQKRSLNDESVSRLVDDVHIAAAKHTAVPIVLDLTNLKFAPSVALGALVSMSKSYSLGGRRVALIGVSSRVKESIGVTRLDRVLEIRDTLEQVIQET